MILHSILANLKTELTYIFVAITGLTGIGLMASPVTSPKVFAVWIFLSEWNMLWTWEWWLRLMIGLAVGVGLWWWQKRKCDKSDALRNANWKRKVTSLQRELRDSEVLVHTMKTRLAIYEKK